MPVFKEPDQEHPLMVDNSSRSIMAVAPAKAQDSAAEFYGKLRDGLRNAAQALLGDAGATLNFGSIVNNANMNAYGSGQAQELRKEMGQSTMKQGSRVKQVLDEHKKLELAVMTGNITPELTANYGGLLKSVSGLPTEEQRKKLEEWKRSQLDEIKGIGNDERRLISSQMEAAKKPAVIDYITERIATRYMVEFPQGDKGMRDTIKGEVTKIWDAAYGEVYGQKPLVMK